MKPTNSQPVIIEPYSPEWINTFLNEAALIQHTIGQFITTIEHIGSTSVPGLAAKPIIDMLIGVKSLSDTKYFVSLLSGLGYHYKPEHESVFPERRYLNKAINGKVAFHLHMVEPHNPFFKRHIAFRDYLRGHPDIAAEYAALKIKLAEKFGSDREGYTDAKSDFIKRIEQIALQSSER